MYLWIDPGIRKLGYGLIDGQGMIVDAGVILHEQIQPSRADQFKRMEQTFNFFVKLLHQYQIQAVGIEKLFFTWRNQNNAEFVYGIRGALMMLFSQHDIVAQERTPQELKKYITGNGLASKELMINVVTRLFHLETAPRRHDTADALGLAWLAKNTQKRGK